jgi:alpha-tubulin suppressor-like RCC1 family protein
VQEHAVRAAAGENFSLVLTRDGLVYSFGAADRGQLGHPNPQDMPTGYPCLVDALAQIKITKIAAGHQHAMAINGKLRHSIELSVHSRACVGIHD